MSEVIIAYSPDDALEVTRFPVETFVSEDSSFSLNILEPPHHPLDRPRDQPPLGHGLVSAGSSVCRICHTNTVREPLISPCRVRGWFGQQTAGELQEKLLANQIKNHKSSLRHSQRFLTPCTSPVLISPCQEYNLTTDPIERHRCKGTLAFVHLSCLERWLNQSCRSYCELCRYRFNAVETPRYKWPEALRIWVSHPRNRRHIQSDLLIFTLLTVVTLGLVAVCLLGIRYFIIEGKKIGISRIWTKGAVTFFLTIVVLGYVTTVYLLIKDQIFPWYRWWKNTVNVRLVIDNEESLIVSSSIETLPDRETERTPSSLTPEEKLGDSDETGI